MVKRYHTRFWFMRSWSDSKCPCQRIKDCFSKLQNFTFNETKKAILNLHNVDVWTSGEVTALSRQPGWVRIPPRLPYSSVFDGCHTAKQRSTFGSPGRLRKSLVPARENYWAHLNMVNNARADARQLEIRRSWRLRPWKLAPYAPLTGMPEISTGH